MDRKPEQQPDESAMQFRSFTIDRAAISADKRTIEIAFSSEMPIETWYGREILDHTPSSVDLSRLNNGGALLLEHNRTDQIGVVESARIDADKKGRAVVRFGMAGKANEIYNDVKDGIRQLVSVGYRLSRNFITEPLGDSAETRRYMSWTPLELSIVSVPADASVGIGRSAKPMKPNLLREADPTGGGGGTAAPTTAAAQSTQPPVIVRAVQNASEDQIEMLDQANRFKQPELYREAVAQGWDRARFSKELLAKLQSNPLTPANPITSDRGQAQSLQIGDMLINSESYRSATKRGMHRTVELDLPILGIRATLLTTGLTGYQRPPGIVAVEQQPLTIAQLFAQGQTNSPTIRIFKESSFTQAATAVGEEGQKPEATFVLAEADFPVKKIAVIGRVSDETFQDFPQVRDYVNNRLVFMVQSLEDNHLLNGSGSSNQITGVLNTSGIQTEAAASSPSPADAVHKALTKIRSVGFFDPDAIVMHPNDWQDLRLMKDGNGQYFAGGPFGGAYGVGGYTAMGPLWGLPVVVTTAIAEGTALVGAFRIGAQLFRREGVNVSTTNSDASDFQYNRICIRVEERLALVVYRALAFCTVTGIA